MCCSPIHSTPVLFYLDFEVDHVREEEKDPLRSITQMAAKCPSAAENKYFEAYIKPMQEAQSYKQSPSFQPGEHKIERYLFKDTWPAFKKWVDSKRSKDQQALFVMHNGYEHDWPILKDECARIGEAVPKYFRPFCTLFLANALHIQLDRNASNSVSGLCNRFNIEKLPAHKALNDVEMLSQIFEKMIGKAAMNDVLNAAVAPQHPVIEVAKVIKAHQTAMLVFFDFESTGLFRNDFTPRAVELAGYIPEKNALFESFINPGCPIPKESQAIHGISDEDVKDAKGFKAVWLQFEDWIQENSGNSVEKIICLAGHNIWKYDLKLYKSECERVGLKHRNWKSIDTLWISKHLHKGVKGVSHKMQDLRIRYGIPEDAAHRAGGDVRVNYEVFKKFVEGVPKEELSKALLSKHPIYEIGAAVRNCRVFKPQQSDLAPNSLQLQASSVASSSDAPIPSSFSVKSISGKRNHEDEEVKQQENEQPKRVFKRQKSIQSWVQDHFSEEE
ncbi:MAG: exonuclease domain-containing protein [Waddliaceae bacterium]